MTERIKQLRLVEYYVLLVINMLREGLDIPEVSLVAILYADKEGFLRNNTSLIQTFGRAARNVDGIVIMYADTMTDSIRNSITETERRRTSEINYNMINEITTKSNLKVNTKRARTNAEAKLCR